MSRICLIRPGATDFDIQGRIKGCLDMPLCEEGKIEAENTAIEISQRLSDEGLDARLETIFTSPCQSAIRTAEIISDACGGKLKELDCLRNVDHGLWQGRLVEDVKRLQPTIYRELQEHPENFAPPGGETLEKAQKRIRKCIDKIVRKHKAGVIGIVVPDPLASLVRQLLTAGSIGDLWKSEADHANWDWIAVHENQLVLI